MHIPLGELADRLDEIAGDRQVVVHCQAGTRSAIATSILERSGRPGIVNLTGGMDAWQDAGLPVVIPPAR